MKYYQKLAKTSETSLQNYAKVEDDGSIFTVCTDKCPNYLEWVAEGNTAEAAD